MREAVAQRLWVVFNGQLQWFGCVLDHRVYLEEKIRYTYNIIDDFL